MPEERPLRRNRDFVALWTGQTVAALGTSTSALAYPLLVLAVTDSPALAGLVTSVLAATAFLVRIPAGVVADHVDRRRLMLVCDAGRLVTVGSLAAAVAVGRVTIWHVLAVAVVEATLGALFAPAEAGAVRRVVPPSQLRDAVTRLQARQQVAGLVGPSLGGALFGAARALPFLADALSYAVSFVTIATLRTPLSRPRPRPPRRRLREELLEGVRWVWRQRFLRFLSIWLAAAGALFTSLGLVTLVMATELGATPAQIGVMFTATGAGGLAGALAAPSLLRRLAPGVVVIGYAWTVTVATVLLLTATSAWHLAALGALAFFPVPVVNAVVQSEVAARAPEPIHGRAVSATTQVTTLLHPLGPAVAGVALETLGTRLAVLVYGGGLLALAVCATASRTVRSGPEPEQPR